MLVMTLSEFRKDTSMKVALRQTLNSRCTVVKISSGAVIHWSSLDQKLAERNRIERKAFPLLGDV